MDGITDCHYRNAWQEVFGAFSRMEKAVSPFVTLVRGKKVKRSHLSDLFPENNRMKVEPQILGNEPELYLPMAEALAGMGYVSVNWNLGCPMRQVASKQRGSGLLPYPEKIDAFLSQVLPSSPLSVSVKIRLGYSRAEEVFPVVEVLNRYPLDYVAVHPRTGRQLYEGTADWEKFDQARRLLKHPCIYNGDVDSVEKAEAFAASFPMVRRVMIGRGVVADPFLPCRLSGFSIAEEEKPVYFARFVAVLWRNYRQGGLPEKAALQRQKLFWSRFRGDFVPDGAFEAVKQVENADAYEEVCRKAFGEAGMEAWEEAR